MKQQIISKALGIIRLKREKNENEAKQNLLQAMGHPEFKKAYEQFKNTEIQLAKDEAFGIKNDGKNFEASKAKLEDIQSKLGIEQINPKYDCPFCKDTGKIDGKYCTCFNKEVASLLLKESGFNNLEEFSKSNFSIFDNASQAKKIYEKMQLWCSTDTSKKTVVLCGQTGTGKTHLLKCMANEIISQGKIAQIYTAFALNQKFLSIHTASENEKENLIKSLMYPNVLFIDDLGTEPVFRNVTREYLYLIINERQVRNLRTVITTNLFPNDIMDRYDERIFSRLVDQTKSIVIELGGKDLRVKK